MYVSPLYLHHKEDELTIDMHIVAIIVSHLPLVIETRLLLRVAMRPYSLAVLPAPHHPPPTVLAVRCFHGNTS